MDVTELFHASEGNVHDGGAQRRGEGWLPVDRLLKDQGIYSRGDALVREVSCPSPGVPHSSKLDSAAQSGRITAS